MNSLFHWSNNETKFADAFEKIAHDGIRIKIEISGLDKKKLEKVLVLLGKGTIGTTDEMVTEAYRIIENIISQI